jgi:hypothetical protein
MEALKAIHSFMQSSTVNKRSELRAKNIALTKYGILRYRSINHENFESWKREIIRHSIV